MLVYTVHKYDKNQHVVEYIYRALTSITFSVYASFLSNENPRNSNCFSVYFV